MVSRDWRCGKSYKKIMKYLIQFSIILLFLLLGEITTHLLNIPIPSAVVGMGYLLFALLTKIIKIEQIQETSDFLLSNMLLFFVPLGVSLVTTFDIIRDSWIQIIVIVVGSTFIVLGITSLIIKTFSKH
jgi:holin-like protein